MRNRIGFIGGMLTGALFGAPLAGAALNVELTVKEPAGIARTAEWVATGVPLAQGAATEASNFRMLSGTTPLPAQFKVQTRWPDGSIKWVLCTFPVTLAAHGEVKATLSDAGGTPPSSRLAIEDKPNALTVDTGAIIATIGKKNFRLLDSVSRSGQMLLKQDADHGATLWISPDRKINAAEFAPEEVVLEEAGPHRACILARGRFKGAMELDGKEMIRWTCRLYFHEGSDRVRIHFTLGNDGAMGAEMKKREYFQFKALRLNFGLQNNGAALTVASAEAEGAPSADAAFAIRQKGAYQKPGIFEASLGDQILTQSDARSLGAVSLANNSGGIALAVREFWQNYPKEISVTPRTLSIALWPEFGGYPEGRDIYNLCGGKQKTHEITLAFGNANKDAAHALAKQINQPLMAMASPEHFADSQALGLFSPADVVTGQAELDALIKRYDDLQRSKPAGLTQAAETRRNGPYYNWMNWGDLNWACGSCSLHYDWTYIMLAHWLRTGQRDFFDWGYAMARHQHDIDLPRSDRDILRRRYLSAYEKETSGRGVTGWHIGRDPAQLRPTISHHWIQGQGLYAALTGDPEAWTALRLNGAEGIRNRLFKQRNLDKEKKTDQARSYGWSMECLLAVYAFTGEDAYLDDARKIFENGLYYMFTDKFNKSGDMGGPVMTAYIVRPLIDYHWHSADPRAIEMLKAMTDKSDDWKDKYEYMMFEDAAAYVYYRTGDETYLEKARMYLGDALLKRRPKFTFRSGAWTKEEAKTSRTGIVHIAIERLKAQGKAPAKL